MINNETLVIRCLEIEAIVKEMVMRGINDNDSLVKAVNKKYQPLTEFEMETYSESIIYAKLGVLN
jgi:hypothetical protein